MFQYSIEFKETNSNEWQPLRSWARPFTDGTTLDETLDEGRINLSLTTRSEAIPPFSLLRINISEKKPDGSYEQVGTINRVVGSSKGTKRKYAGRELWDWSIQTLEETKLLERYVCDSMTSTNYLTKNYEGKFEREFPNYYELESSWKGSFNITWTTLTPTIYGPIPLKDTPYELRVPVYRAYYERGKPVSETGYLPGKIGVVTPSGTTTIFGTYLLGLGDSVPDIKYSLTEVGTYTFFVEYVYLFTSVYRADTKISVFETVSPRTDPTITSVCERLLSAGITRREGIDTQKFTLDTAFAAKYANVPAPEFSFTRQTLFEALLTVGGYIHAIPRLNGNVVTFDELGGDDEIDMTNFPKQVYCDKVRDINDFCATLDSPAQNLLNTQDRVNGAITELGNDYITVRAEDSAILIEANNAIIRTSLPINQIVKIECGYIPGRAEPVGDITAYIYEAAEYDALSSYWDSAYPYSKGYALRYAQGDNKITALQTKQEYPTSVGKDLADPAIINIIRVLTGVKIKPTDIAKLAFKVTYVPIVTSRVTQCKPYGTPKGTDGDASWDNTLFYNQGGNVVESSFYGDKMKGAIARLGNEVEERTYDFIHYSQLPKCGQKLDGKYIARIDAEYDLIRIRATLTLTKNFNMLSQYVGLNSNIRMYDISEKQSVERFVHYSEKIYIGKYTGIYSDKPPMFQNVRSLIEGTLKYNSTDSAGKVQVAIVNGKDRDGNDIGKPVILPVVAFGFGNSLVFQFSMYDNYGAGFQNSGEFNNRGVQRLVPYSDGLGEMETMSFEMYNDGWFVLNGKDQEPGGRANLYPQYVNVTDPSYGPYQVPLIKTGNYPLIVKKDSREALNVVYQVHFVATDPSVILGPSLAYSNEAVVAKNSKFEIYFFEHELNMFNKVVDLKNATKYTGEYEVFSTHTIAGGNTPDAITIEGIVNTSKSKTYKSWAFIEVQDNSTYGTIFVGRNETLAPGATASNMYFTMRTNEE